MLAVQPGWMSRGHPERRRRRVRFFAAASSIATATLYFGIGAGIVKVVDATRDAPDLFMFGVAAGAAFALGAMLLLALDHRGLWLLGAVLQVIVIVMYVAVSPQRTPPFEPWGILIKALQAAILVALAYLVIRQPVPRPRRTLRPI